MDVKTLGLTACALLAVAIVGRIFWLFTNRTPVLAHSENVDILGDSLPGDPLNPDEHPQGIERLSPFHTADMRVEYEVGGQRYEHDIETHNIDGVDDRRTTCRSCGRTRKTRRTWKITGRCSG